MSENYTQQQIRVGSEPLGASSEEYDVESAISDCACKCIKPNINNVKEKQQLNSFLLSLTTHFAQVQFRLRQVINAPPEEKDNLLKSLEEFASQGVNDVPLIKKCMDEVKLAKEMKLGRNQQRDIIEMLKIHMRKFENYICPHSTTDALHRNSQVLNINHCEIFHNEINMQIRISNSCIAKEHFVNQLKIQVADLEKFVLYLQDETKKIKPVPNKNSSISLFKIIKLLQVFASLQVGCGFFKLGNLQDDFVTDIHDWKNPRSRLAVAIKNVTELVEQCSKYRDSNPEYWQTLDDKLTTIVRENLATALRDLIQHGICLQSRFNLTRLLCKNTFRNWKTHAWEIILKYYYLKNGEEYTSEPLNTLSHSFQLDLVDAEHLTTKHHLFRCINDIISKHSPYKRGSEAQFKAFICAGLNSSELVNWLLLIFKCKKIVNNYYLPWSYVRETGLQDVLTNLDNLMDYEFHLPVDFDIREFQNMQDVIN